MVKVGVSFGTIGERIALAEAAGWQSGEAGK
jgi:hypothetical protein